jgi:hypothetical protein
MLAIKLMTERIKKTKRKVFPISKDIPPTPLAPSSIATKPITKKAIAALNIKISLGLESHSNEVWHDLCQRLRLKNSKLNVFIKKESGAIYHFKQSFCHMTVLYLLIQRPAPVMLLIQITEETGMLTQTELKKKWLEIKDGITNIWGTFPEEELDKTQGNLDQIVLLIHHYYSEPVKTIKKKIDHLLNSFDNTTDRIEKIKTGISSYGRNPLS